MTRTEWLAAERLAGFSAQHRGEEATWSFTGRSGQRADGLKISGRRQP